MGKPRAGANTAPSPRTVGRGRPLCLVQAPQTNVWSDGQVALHLGDSRTVCATWPAPQAIVSDGAYGILGFDGDTCSHHNIAAWYEPHIAAWSARATPQTTLWFWNTEIGWAAAHPVLEAHGWRYVNANIWNKGKAHIAGNINTRTIRRFPVVTEMCVQYVREPRIEGLTLQVWLLREWLRTGLPRKRANLACGVADVATRKYLDPGHMWYAPPPAMFAKLVAYANTFGHGDGKPYFSADGITPMTADDWAAMRAIFRCPVGVTNVWSRNPLKGSERIAIPGRRGSAAHLNQKPLDLMRQIIAACTDPGSVVWEPFGGLFSASLAARELGRRAYAAEIDPTYFQLGLERF